ncbi:MAG: SDR family NAD(P)-dependent oxidoreductase [Reyranella sp.]|nr:SDR family NAD(P)-dependent oxidoreductase [Reyranella sp.]
MTSIDPDAKWALVTGAANGIGAAFAARLAAQNFGLWLVDKQHDALMAVTRDIAARHGVTVTPVVADLQKTADQDAVTEVIAQAPGLDLLVNNAGFGDPDLFQTVLAESHVAMLQVHVVAPVCFSRAALPAMIARKKGAIINVCSMIQYVHTPGNTTYGATKLFLDSFSQRLNLEVRRHGIEIQSLIPGYAISNFGKTAEYKGSPRSAIPAYLWSSAESVVDASLRQLGTGRLKCVPGAFNRVVEFCLRRGLFSPQLMRRWIA